MSTQTVIIIIAILMIVVIAFASLGGGPRITSITRRRETKNEDRDDA